MKILAFDIGMHNFAWAILNIDKQQVVIERFDKVDLTSKKIYRTLHNYLLEQEEYFKNCQVILIEQQMKTNIHALKMSQHVYAFFLLRHPDKDVREYSSIHKTRVFGYISTTKTKRKQFAINQVYKLFESDPVILDMLSVYNKKDDICDCILMCLAFASQINILKLIDL